jgi:hypothetical protein
MEVPKAEVGGDLRGTRQFGGGCTAGGTGKAAQICEGGGDLGRRRREQAR